MAWATGSATIGSPLTHSARPSFEASKLCGVGRAISTCFCKSCACVLRVRFFVICFVWLFVKMLIYVGFRG